MGPPPTAEPVLDGLRVIDLTSTFMGPYCTMLMARMGADVVKIEGAEGDVLRGIGTGRHPGMGPIFLSANHGKRSVALDLRTDQGRAVLRRLIAGADVFITNLRPGPLQRLDLEPETVRAFAPGVIMCTLTGFGSAGPDRDRPAYDDVIQAAGGIAAVQGGRGGEPEYVRNVFTDKATALMGLSAILAALLRRATTGRGRHVEVPMLESMVSFLLLEYLGPATYEPPQGPPGYSRTSSPFRRPYATADGYLGVVAYTDRHWLEMFQLIGRPDLAADERFATVTLRTEHIDALYAELAAALPSRTTDEWLEAFARANIPAERVRRLEDLHTDPQLEAAGLFEPVSHHSEGELRLPRLPIVFDGEAASPVRGAPRLGEHGAEVLREAGLTESEIAGLREAGALLGSSD